MAKLYFKYGVMGSSKTTQALITKFNYEERNMRVWFIKPAIDTRDGIDMCRSRIGISAKADVIFPDDDIHSKFASVLLNGAIDVVIADECNFFTEKQIDALDDIVMFSDIDVICYGLRTDFLTRLFPASKRLFEIADSISEVKYICDCGNKATVNARFDGEGNVLTSGEQVYLGGNESYRAMCRKCWLKKIDEQKQGKQLEMDAVFRASDKK